MMIPQDFDTFFDKKDFENMSTIDFDRESVPRGKKGGCSLPRVGTIIRHLLSSLLNTPKNTD